MSVALGAAALGDEVHLALFGEPLRLFLSDRFDAGPPSLWRLAQDGRALTV